MFAAPFAGSALAASLIWAVVWLLLTPAEALAWGPGTHVAIGQAVLSSLHLLPPAIRTLLERNRIAYLYGSVAADISFAKKYAETGRHSHHWHIGEEILAAADTEELHAVALGYLSHLAADTVAHNIYVPRRLLLTSTTQSVGHTYWEHRMDVELGNRYVKRARRIVLRHDHEAADELFDRVLSRTLFSFRTNRRIFRGMMAFQDDMRWKQVFDEVLKRSRFEFPREVRDQYMRHSYESVMERLARGHAAKARALDPIGERHLRLAKQIRREALASSRGRLDPEELLARADEFFPLPGDPLIYLPRARDLTVPGLGAEVPPHIRAEPGSTVRAPDARRRGGGGEPVDPAGDGS